MESVLAERPKPNDGEKRENMERMYMLESSHPMLSAISSIQNHVLSPFPQ